MKITRVEIEKFRSIRKACFRMGEITAVVGENNAGKTAVLRALNCVLNYKYEEESFFKKRHQYGPRANTYITITFEDVPDSEVYRPYLFGSTLTLQFLYSYSENKKKYVIIKGAR